MTAIDRTAYPRLDARLTPSELAARHELTAAELDFVRSHALGRAGRLILAALLKTRQDLGYFPPPDAFPDPLLAVLAGQLGIEPASTDTAGPPGAKSLYRYHAAVRFHLRARPYDPAAESTVTGVILDAARTMSDPADLINRAIETLRGEMIDVPAFSTLDRLAGHLRARVHGRIFGTVASSLISVQTAALDALLVRAAGAATTGFNQLKQTPGPRLIRRCVPGRTVRTGFLAFQIRSRSSRTWLTPNSASSRPRPRCWKSVTAENQRTGEARHLAAGAHPPVRDAMP